MNEPRRDGYWPKKLASLAALAGADAIAVVLALRDQSVMTYVQHNLAAPAGWEQRAAGGAIARAIAEKTARSGMEDLGLSDGRVARTLLAAPILWQETAIGALVAFRGPTPFDQNDQQVLARAADLVACELAEANALWRAQQASTTLASRDRLRTEMQRELAPLGDADAILDKATHRLAEIFGADGVSMMLIDPAGDLVTRAAVGMREDVVRKARHKVGEGISGWVAKEGQPLLLQGAVHDARFQGVDPSIGGALVAPLRAEDKVLGVVSVKSRAGEQKYGEVQLQDLTQVAEDVAAALNRAAELRRLEDDRRQALILFELSRLSVQSGDGASDLETAAVMLADTLHFDVLGIWIAEAQDRTLRLRAGRGYGDVLPNDVAIEGDAALQGAFGEKRSQRYTAGETRPSWTSPRADQYALAPVLAGQHSIGVLVVGRATTGIDESEVDFATALGEYLGALAQRTASSDALQHSAMSERRRIAQELHDGLAQELTGVVLALEGCQRALERDPDVLPTQLAKAARDARACLSDIRQYMTALRQQDPSALTLPVTVARLVDDLRRTSGITVELEEVGTERALPPQLERAVVRITQEALHNVAQHAQASRSKVTLAYDDDAATITIEDDGQGFAVEQTIAGAEHRGRFGLLGMKERAEAASGSLSIRSEPGQGTIVRARMLYESGPKLNVVPAWPGAPRSESEVAPQPIEDVEEMTSDRRRGMLGRLFGR